MTYTEECASLDSAATVDDMLWLFSMYGLAPELTEVANGWRASVRVLTQTYVVDAPNRTHALLDLYKTVTGGEVTR